MQQAITATLTSEALRIYAESSVKTLDE